MTDIDTVAEAIWRVDVPSASEGRVFADLSENGAFKPYYRRMAQAAIEALTRPNPQQAQISGPGSWQLKFRMASEWVWVEEQP